MWNSKTFICETSGAIVFDLALRSWFHSGSERISLNHLCKPTDYITTYNMCLVSADVSQLCSTHSSDLIPFIFFCQGSPLHTGNYLSLCLFIHNIPQLLLDLLVPFKGRGRVHSVSTWADSKGHSVRPFKSYNWIIRGTLPRVQTHAHTLLHNIKK